MQHTAGYLEERSATAVCFVPYSWSPSQREHPAAAVPCQRYHDRWPRLEQCTPPAHVQQLVTQSVRVHPSTANTHVIDGVDVCLMSKQNANHVGHRAVLAGSYEYGGTTLSQGMQITVREQLLGKRDIPSTSCPRPRRCQATCRWRRVGGWLPLTRMRCSHPKSMMCNAQTQICVHRKRMNTFINLSIDRSQGLPLPINIHAYILLWHVAPVLLYTVPYLALWCPHRHLVAPSQLPRAPSDTLAWAPLGRST